jgi:hypothetical protein
MSRWLFLAALFVACKGSSETDTSESDTDSDSDTDADADADSDADSDSDADTDTTNPDHFFPDASPWYTPVDHADVDDASDDMIRDLQALGWGLGRFQMDFSIEVLEADASTPRETFEPTGDFYDPDCDELPVPMPEDGNLEGEDGYECTSDGDCHLLVAERDEGKLYEMWRANVVDGTFYGGCLAVWDMSTVYTEGRGDQCSSADAAGYPMAPLLFTADEIAAGEIDHAIRFALPNDAIDNDAFFHPATHATTAGDDGPIPYGARLRLKGDFDMDRIADPDARVIAVALQKYGMFLADGGNVTLMGRSDARSTAKYEDLLEDYTRALVGIEPQDFEVVKLEPPEIPLTYDCVRNGL